MNKSRLEAFTDGVIAIIITILVLELRRPEGGTFAALWELRHAFFIYFVSFATLAIYWNNHHHLFQAVTAVSGKILWLNILLLLCISLFPFTTSWVSTYLFSQAAAITYGLLMLTADVVWLLLSRALLEKHSQNSILSQSLQGSKKSAFSISIITTGLIIGWFWPPAVIIGCLVSLTPWIIPDKRIEQYMQANPEKNQKD